jgi:hypothetical protein
MSAREDWLAARAYHALRAALESSALRLPPAIDAPTIDESLGFITDTLKKRDLPRCELTDFITQFLQFAPRSETRSSLVRLLIMRLIIRFPRDFSRAIRGILKRSKHERKLRRLDRENGRLPPLGESVACAYLDDASTIVRCYDGWADFDDALQLLTPGGRGLWEGVAFTRCDTRRPDWVGVFTHTGRFPAIFSASPNRVFFAIGEPPIPEYRIYHSGQGSASLVLSCDVDLCKEGSRDRNYLLGPALTRSWSVRKSYDELVNSEFPEKSRSLSWITSNKSALPGHRRRLEFLQRMRSRLDFDLYGKGFAPLIDKWDGLAPYRYSIAFENTSSPYYFTEKIMDCFVAGTMPIYYGSPTISEFFPAEAIVIFDPDDPDVFRKIDDIVRSDLYKQREKYLAEAKHLVLQKYNTFAYIAILIKSMDRPPQPTQHIHIKEIADPLKSQSSAGEPNLS